MHLRVGRFCMKNAKYLIDNVLLLIMHWNYNISGILASIKILLVSLHMPWNSLKNPSWHFDPSLTSHSSPANSNCWLKPQGGNAFQDRGQVTPSQDAQPSKWRRGRRCKLNTYSSTKLRKQQNALLNCFYILKKDQRLDVFIWWIF